MTRGGQATTRRQLAAVASAVFVLVAAVGAGALTLSGSPFGPGGGAAGSGAIDERVAGLHEDGVTGENVTVGVVDVTGFDTDHPDLSGRVAAARSFAAGESVANGGEHGHGTAAAAVVARTAPDADLYLAAFDTAEGFRAAVVWLVESGVDVVVAPVSFYGLPGDGSSSVARMADYARDRGVTFVAAAGNLGRGHWEGRFDPVGAGVHRFENGTRNHIRPRHGRTLELWVSWTDPTANLTVEVYAETDEGPRLVARSRPYEEDDYPNARIEARLQADTDHFFVLRGSPSAAGAEVEVVSPTHAFETGDRAGSVVPPATARGAIAVGAYDPDAGRVEPFSSAGPVGTRAGVDVVAPGRVPVGGAPSGFVGSSAAAPYVAGVAALLLDAAPDLSPRAVEVVLERTARDLGPDGTDRIAGHGAVAPRRAVEQARGWRRSNADLSYGEPLVRGRRTVG